MGPESDGSHIFEMQNVAFLMKKALQKHPLKKLHFGLLRHQVDTLVAILSPNHCRSMANFW